MKLSNNESNETRGRENRNCRVLLIAFPNMPVTLSHVALSDVEYLYGVFVRRPT